MRRRRRCVLCGAVTYGRHACPAHRDILKNDTTHYAPELRKPDDRPEKPRGFLEGWLRAA